MSLNSTPLKVIESIDPVVRLNNVRKFEIVRGGNEVTFQQQISSSYSNSSIQVTCNPPSQSTVIDRNLYIKTQWETTFTNTAIVAAGGFLLHLAQTGSGANAFDGLRAMPFASITQTATCKINNDSVTTNVNDYITAFQHYSNSDSVQDYYSTSPQMPDQYIDQVNAPGTSRNALGPYGDNPHQITRGSFAFDEVVNPVAPGGGSAIGTLVATVKYTITEPLYLSPFLFGGAVESGLIGVSTLSFNWTLGNLSRMWTSTPGQSTPYTVSPQIKGAQLLFRYITPNLLSPIPSKISYPYNEVLALPSTLPFPMTPALTADFQMQSYQLNCIPNRMYVFVRRNNAEVTNLTTDTFCNISKVTVQFGNRAGLLSSASEEDLYYISKRNGYNGTWLDWHGAGASATAASGFGSVFCVNFATDLGMSPIEAPGLLQNTQLSMKVTAKNLSRVDTINAVLYVVLCTEGTLNVSNGFCSHEIGVVSREDVERLSGTADAIPYDSSRNVYGSAWYNDLWSGIKDVGKFALDNVSPLMTAYKTITGKGVSAGKRRKHTKATRKRTKGAGVTGGQSISRARLRKRMH
jgi:hypothetical protein